MKPINKNNNGFTIAELLIVIAIIAVLVAVSIPIFTGQMEKARLATNRANIRAAKAAAYVYYAENGFPKAGDTHAYYVYSVDSGKVSVYSSGSYGNYKIPDYAYDPSSHSSYLRNGVYQYIIVYIHENDEASDSAYTIQTNPHYDSKTSSMVYVVKKPYS